MKKLKLYLKNPRTCDVIIIDNRRGSDEQWIIIRTHLLAGTSTLDFILTPIVNRRKKSNEYYSEFNKISKNFLKAKYNEYLKLCTSELKENIKL